MHILIVGNSTQAAIIEKKIKENIKTSHVAEVMMAESPLESYDAIFDFTIDESPENLSGFEDHHTAPVFVNSVKTSLAETALMLGGPQFPLFGFNGLPFFVGLEKWELSCFDSTQSTLMFELLERLGIEGNLVADRVGMVAPRVICMIINEAYYTLQEGTAGKEDIDLGMKLGTNYPYGPFEWSKLIGIQHVYELLDAVYEDTKDERYKICPLLKRDYLLGE